MNLGEWQQLDPEAAAREVLRRVETHLAPAQRHSSVAALRDEKALAAAFAAASASGPLRGVPYMLKDLFDVAGMPTRAGSSFLPEVRPAPAEDSRIVRDLGAAGAVLAGKTHLFEFAWGLTGENAHYGDCEHPRFPGRTSGGSSSGSAVAVAADIVPLAIGTDTGGSIRVPAAFCGIFGYRGIPGDPWAQDAVPLAPSFDTAGWFTRSAGDMGTVFAALVRFGEAPRAPHGYFIEMPGMDPEVAGAYRAAAAGLADPADDRLARELVDAFGPAAEVYGVLAGHETWKIQRKWADRYRSRYGPLLIDRLERARAVSPAQLAAVEPSLQAIRRAWSRYFLGHDFLIMPATPFAALARDGLTPANRLRMLSLTSPASLCGLPVLTVPFTLPSGLSSGLQVVFSPPKFHVVPWALGACGHSSD